MVDPFGHTICGSKLISPEKEMVIGLVKINI